MNIQSKNLLLGSALLLSLGAINTVSARAVYYGPGWHHNRVTVVQPAPVYAYRPYHHHRHGIVVVGPEAVYAHRPYHPYHNTVIVRRHR